MKIKMVHSIIELHFLYEEQYRAFFHKYIVDEGEPDLVFCQDLYKEDEIKGDLKLNTKHYTLYEQNGVDVQYQKKENEEQFYAKIRYQPKEYHFSCADGQDHLTLILLVQYGVTRFLCQTYDCILMHGSSILYQKYGLLFTAPSGTGKSTHSALWKKYYDVTYINDDKNFIVYENQKLYLFGNPWSGKHRLDNNIIVPLHSIVFLYQHTSNEVTRLSRREAFMKLMTQVIQPLDAKEYPKWNKMIDHLLDVPIFRLGATISKEAVDTIRHKVEELEYESI